ncbi:unnamed protein product [Brachionus calyciflorus]|uniref:Aladin seven-bladed propeller domain-containing protein n=1 Tax=Brachionus calyciflorus TaxID=104777 RepID=A0A813M5A6_9BILA|nr:unnamed protein product [Brachionus calyciflorus]
MNFLSNMTNLTYAEEPSQIHELQSLVNANSKSLLLNFPSIPLSQPIYGCSEINGQFQFGLSPDFDKKLLSKHDIPTYEAISDILTETSNLYSTHVNVIDKQPVVKRLFGVYLENGLIGLCEEIVNSKPNQQIPNILKTVSSGLIKIIDAINGPFNPLMLSKKEHEMNFAFIKGSNWKSSLIHAFQWHPHCNKYAVAFKNDIVKVYSNKQGHAILKHQNQVNITCLAWKPFYSSIIAVGCANAIIIWDTDSSTVSLKPSSSCSFVLSKRYHNDIMDIQWYPKSDFLLSVASKDNEIIIWDVTLKSCVPVKRIGNTGFSLARFSPNGFKLFTADLSTSFRIWKPTNYTSEKWINLYSRCNAACWSPDGSILLFTCDDCPLLYSLRFLNSEKQELEVVCDLSSISLFENMNDQSQIDTSAISRYTIGGSINDMSWDPTGQRLAISFKKKTTDSHINVVAIFLTKFQPQFQVLPCGFVNDMENAFPVNLSFKPEFESGALLTISWSNSRIQHVPFYFNRIVDDYGAPQTITSLSCY